MKVLILGATGMLGHKLYHILSKTFDVAGTIRSTPASLKCYGFFHKSAVIPHIEVKNRTAVEKAIDEIKPNVVINCIGIIKSIKEAQDQPLNIYVNALFPHKLYKMCRQRDIRLIHISTDCVFSGKTGNYKETDIADAEDTYGRTKYLGEIAGEGALTIRTSIIGRELSTSNNLVEWFISNQEKKVQGYTNAIFSGFPTICLAQIIAQIIANTPNLSGLYHISSEPISKYHLLTLIRDKIGLNIDIEKYPHYYCNRSLDSTRYKVQTGFKSRSWEEMIDEFARDALQYEHWRTR